MPEAEFVPTPAEILAECAKIRATWSESERRLRAGIVDDLFSCWVVPVVHMPVRRRGQALLDEGR